MKNMFPRALIVWLMLLAIAFINGALRELFLATRLGSVAGHLVSTAILSGAILLLAWGTVGWIAPVSAYDAWLIGLVWVVLTFAFETLGGHYLFNNSWSVVFADYNILRGRIWILVLITTLIAPRLALHFRSASPPG